MAKAKTLFIWEGVETVTITRGLPLQSMDNNEFLKQTKVKHKGFFTPWIPIFNLNPEYVGTTKKLIVGDRIVEGWEAVRIKLDFITHEPFLADIVPQHVEMINSLRNEVEKWRAMYYSEKNKNLGRADEDKFWNLVDKRFKRVSQARGQFYQEGMGMGGFGYPFASRFGMGGGMQPQGGSSQESL